MKQPAFCECPDCVERAEDEALADAIAMHDRQCSYDQIGEHLGMTGEAVRDTLIGLFLEDAAHEVKH